MKDEIKKKGDNEKLQKRYIRLKEQYEKLKTQRTDRVCLLKNFNLKFFMIRMKTNKLLWAPPNLITWIRGFLINF